MRQNAANWLELADKVWALRRDRLDSAERTALAGRRDELRRDLAQRADAGKLKLGIEALEGALRRTGGAVYPKSALTENIEFFLVAAIVILGIRTYFIQPFKIPTNSMWPTYYGMTSEHPPWPTDGPVPLQPPAAEPAEGIPARVWRFLTLGAVRKEAIAPVSGQISVQVWQNSWQNFELAYTKVRGRKWLIVPTDLREYRFYVNGQPTTVDVPLDFSGMDQIFAESYFGSEAAFIQQIERSGQAGRALSEGYVNNYPAWRVPIGRQADAGQPVIRFDLLTGDQLFVDRISYQFVRPKVGQGFVFRTDLIPAIGTSDYFIKRLIGVPGDTIEIHPPAVYRNGAPITGSKVFEWEARRIPPYAGYTEYKESTVLPPGGTVHVPSGDYFAMGDNSADSEDSRYWGFVPAAAVIGRPLFIYYPLTRRWGPAH